MNALQSIKRRAETVNQQDEKEGKGGELAGPY
jgi:hypothetical protein